MENETGNCTQQFGHLIMARLYNSAYQRISIKTERLEITYNVATARGSVLTASRNILARDKSWRYGLSLASALEMGAGYGANCRPITADGSSAFDFPTWKLRLANGYRGKRNLPLLVVATVLSLSVDATKEGI